MTELRKFEIPCYFGSVRKSVTVFIGNAAPKHHPLQFQAAWITKENGGQIPLDIMDTMEKVRELAEKNNVEFADLWQYALESSSAPQIIDSSEEEK